MIRAFLVLATLVLCRPAWAETVVTISGDDFLINGKPTYAGRVWNGHRVEGLLMNNRVVQGTFDDLNPETVARWKYPDTDQWDPERNVREFLAAMSEWKAHGVLAFTVNFQGGSPEGYSKEQPWENHPFNADGTLRPAFMERMKRILDEADRLGMVPIVGYFYFGQSRRLESDAKCLRATDALTKWLLDGGWKNVLVEINNESNPGYRPPVLRPDRVHELVARVRDTTSADGRRLLVGTSFPVKAMPTVEVLRASDFVLLHGNAFANAADLVAKIGAARALDPQRVIPVVVNEDDHNDFDAPDGRLASAVAAHVSWGWFDWRRPGESFDEGYQSVPVNWGLSSERKRAFHRKVAEITGAGSFPDAKWEPVETKGHPSARHEAAFIECEGRFYLLGGRGIKPVDIYDPKSGVWTEGAKPPVEIHHFQPVVWEGRILLTGAMTGKYPHETALPRIQVYDPESDTWSEGPEIPADRRRGGAGAVISGGKLYLVCGIQNGHWDGWVAWLDALDLKSGKWEILPDAPRVRDHFQAAIVDGKIYAAGGRKTSGATKQVFDLTISEVDVYDLAAGSWSTLASPEGDLPTPRAGNSAIAIGHELIIGGGESMAQKEAHREVEALDLETGHWHPMPPLARGRHGTGLVLWQSALHTCAGSGGRGGGPELDTMESLTLKEP